jgi:hypothetical protein
VLFVDGVPTEANERLTATTATVLLVLLAVEGFTILAIGTLLSIHIVVGLILIPPVVLKLASAGFRFLRYYSGDPAFVEKGPPHVVMRLLAPLLVASTLTVLATGLGLLALGPHRHRALLLGLHKASFIAWFAAMSIHVLVYAPRLPRAVLSRGAWKRLALVASSVAAGAVLAASTYSLAGPWLHRDLDFDHDHGRESVAASVLS